MQLYSKAPVARTRQIVADVVALALIVGFVLLGVGVGNAISALAEFGRQVEQSASGLQGTLGDAANTLGSIPLVGSAASAPLKGASSAAASLADAGRQQQQLVGGVALTVGLVVALVPIAIVLLVWLRRRIAFVRRAGRARMLMSTVAGLELLALTALTTQEPRELLRVAGPNPVAGWRAGDPATIRMLADRTLRDAGVR